MNLKKSDKIVALIGVIILIIAAVVIVTYVATEEEEDNNEPEWKSFRVNWMEDNTTLNINDAWVGTDEAYTVPIEINDIQEGAVIKEIIVTISWEDDMIRGLFKKNKGLDTLTAEITLVGGETKIHDEVGWGQEELYFFVNDKPNVREIDEVKNLEEAKEKLMAQFPGKNTAELTTNIMTMKGEKIFKDPGNYFDLHVECVYYYPQFPEEDSQSKDDLNTQNTESADNQGTMTYSSLGMPGKH